MKYLASDLDGTLIHDNKISQKDIDAINKFREAGNKFIVATGRGLHGIKKAFEEHSDITYDYLVACNGSIIYDKDDNIISKKVISKETAEKLYKSFKDHNDATFACGFGDGHYIVGLKENMGIKDEVLEYAKQLTEEEFYANERECEMVGFICRDEDAKIAEQIVPLIEDVIKGEVEVFRNQFFIDIAPINCTKGEGIKSILEIEAASTEDVITIGDSLNDLSMLCITENGFTFNNAEDVVKEVASHCVDSVAECIEKVMNI